MTGEPRRHPHRIRAAHGSAHRNKLPLETDAESCVSIRPPARGRDGDKINALFFENKKMLCWTEYLCLILINDKRVIMTFSCSRASSAVDTELPRPTACISYAGLFALQSLSHVRLSAAPGTAGTLFSVHGIFEVRILEWVAQVIFPTQGSNPEFDPQHLLHWQAHSLPLSHQGSHLSRMLLIIRPKEMLQSPQLNINVWDKVLEFHAMYSLCSHL